MVRKNILIIGRRGRGKTSLLNLLACGPDWKNPVIPVNHGVGSVETDLIPKQAKEPLSDFFLQDTTGFDETVDPNVIFKELQEIVKSKTIHGVIFILQSGRLDDCDKGVFMLFLQTILENVPSSMIGAVFTHSSDDLLEENNFSSYLEKQPEGLEKDFLLDLQQRVKNKITFIDNPDPGKISRKKSVNQTNQEKREESTDNLKNLIDQFEGEYDFDQIDGICEAAKRRLEYFKQNKYKISESVMKVGVGTLVKLTGAAVIGGALVTVAAGAVVTFAAAGAAIAGAVGVTAVGVAVADAALVSVAGAALTMTGAATAGIAELGRKIGICMKSDGEKKIQEVILQVPVMRESK